MVFADQQIIKFDCMQFRYKTKQILIYLFLLCFVLLSNNLGQTKEKLSPIEQSQIEFDNGNYPKAILIARFEIEQARKRKNKLLISRALNITAISQISLRKYSEAEKNLNDALQYLSDKNEDTIQKAKIYLNFAFLNRSQNKFIEALSYSKKAIGLVPENRQILAEHYLNVGRILFASGYDISAIIWLEKAKDLLETENITAAKLDTYRFLTLAWWAKLNYQTALKYARKWETEATGTLFKYKYRQALFDSSTILSESGQKAAAYRYLENGWKISQAQNNSFQSGLFLTSLLLNSLDNNEMDKAKSYLEQLEKLNQNDLFSFEILLGKAVISAFSNQRDQSEELFSQLDKMEVSSEFTLPGWKLKIAKRNNDWKKVIELNQKLLDLTVSNNFRDELPLIHLDFARAYVHLNQPQKSLEHLEKSIGLVEEIRQSDNSQLSLGILETYHNAYRLLTQTKSENPQESFELADFLKARLLKDKINNAALNPTPDISKVVRQKLETLTLKYIEDQSNSGEIEKIEKSITAKIPELDLKKTDLSGLGNIPALDDSAVISYFFTLDKKLMAFVWEKGKPLQIFNLPISEDEVEIAATTTQRNIKNRIFFKRDGKVLYDKLLKPLSLTGKHLIIIPDKSLWKIPFQALSSDGEKYLIEEKLISYAPSVSILLEQLKNPKPYRQTLQAFANSTFENKVLQYANTESTTVAGIYDSKPIINATVADFEQRASSTDLMHFSMHAQVDNEQPLDSYLGFRKFGKDDGRLTVEELLNIKLKKGSLVFLASCDTNAVLSGEGLVSLAWAMMGSGATTVISSGWEANDKSTAIFTSNFYKFYKQGSSSAEAIQKAALELIKDKSGNMHEPYYWADFTLNGDFR